MLSPNDISLICTPQMKAAWSFFCLVLLSFGACFPTDNEQEMQYPREELTAMKDWPSLGMVEAPKLRRASEDLWSLINIAKELQGFGKERAGIRFRFGRQQESPEEENGVVDYLSEDGGEKRGDTLGSLAEELSGYNRRKGGFNFRFGRRRRMALF